jgi:hypothetical protein
MPLSGRLLVTGVAALGASVLVTFALRAPESSALRASGTYGGLRPDESGLVGSAARPRALATGASVTLIPASAPPPLDEFSARILEGDLSGRGLVQAANLKAALEREVVRWALTARGRCARLSEMEPTLVRVSCRMVVNNRRARIAELQSLVVAKGAPIQPKDLDCLVGAMRENLPEFAVPMTIQFDGSKDFRVALKNSSQCAL